MAAIEIIELLLDHGANLFATDCLGATALTLAAFKVLP
jgi:ankyrin repeat protein